MKRYFIVTGTVTYAMKARELLSKNGYQARIERISSAAPGMGCGYAVAVNTDPTRAVALLRENRIKVLHVLNEQD